MSAVQASITALETASPKVPQRIAVDTLVVYVIAAVKRFAAARDRVLYLCPDLVDDPAARRVMASALFGKPICLTGLQRDERARALEIAGQVSSTSNPHTEEWAMYLIRLLAEKRYGALLAGQLRWAADEICAGTPTRKVLATVNQTASITLGITPFDGQETWGAES